MAIPYWLSSSLQYLFGCEYRRPRYLLGTFRKRHALGFFGPCARLFEYRIGPCLRRFQYFAGFLVGATTGVPYQRFRLACRRTYASLTFHLRFREPSLRSFGRLHALGNFLLPVVDEFEYRRVEKIPKDEEQQPEINSLHQEQLPIDSESCE